ncbi:MAG: 4-(cytidine 5'-diphospho)-2-C-methyl-D-erythritol kinase, partial [Candidatus Marinimicrobia bacterium]|nr:4-(cytidine 5'-diphospho)-2-C-methyl-D-erythritol kinase [Candidatus Neomarinimicrobiota bacterium]
MNSAELKAYAKINVGLRITGQREDGYHTLKTLFQTVSMHDVVKIELKNEPGVEFESKGEKVPDGEENLCVSAARIFLESISQSGGVSIFLDKKIPVGAGLGGGSSDAACVIRGLNDLLKIGLTGREMENIASEVGADVPFFIRGGCRYAEGIGDLLSPGNIPEDLCVLLAVPEIRIETSWAYNSL